MPRCRACNCIQHVHTKRLMLHDRRSDFVRAWLVLAAFDPNAARQTTQTREVVSARLWCCNDRCAASEWRCFDVRLKPLGRPTYRDEHIARMIATIAPINKLPCICGRSHVTPPLACWGSNMGNIYSDFARYSACGRESHHALNSLRFHPTRLPLNR
jgi:hypothetical protein